MRLVKIPVAALALWMAVGCSAQVNYIPQFSGARAPTRFVRVEVADERPPNEGGGDPSRIGTVRGGFGNPFDLRDKDPNAVINLVGDATSDALASCGVGVRPDAPERVVARILKLWEDGYMGYEASVVVDLAVVDASGAPRWTARVAGSAADVIAGYGGASELVAKALGVMARNAAMQCVTPEFQRALP